MSFIKKLFQKLKNIFVKEVPIREQPKATVTVTRIPIVKPKVVKIEKPKRIKPKEKKVRVEKRLPKTIVGFRCTLAINYVIHHHYYSMKLTYYTRNVEDYYKQREGFEEELKESVEREVGYPKSEWWFPDIPSEEITLTRIPRELLNTKDLKTELVKVGKRKVRVKAK